MSKLNYSDDTRKASTTEGKKSEENVTLETNKASKTPESTQDSSTEQKEKSSDSRLEAQAIVRIPLPGSGTGTGTGTNK